MNPKEKIISKLIIYPIAFTLGLGTYVLGESQISKNASTKVITNIEKEEKVYKEFEVGEHIISIQIKNPLREEKIIQYPYYEGYELIGIDGDIEGGCLLYRNTIPVFCESSGINNQNKYVYTTIGIPKDISIEDKKEEEEKIFQEGEHILSVPINNPIISSQQYQYQEGYEIVDIAIYTDGKYQEYQGGAVIYKNTVPVKCRKTRGKYISFGIPIEKYKTKKKTNN